MSTLEFICQRIPPSPSISEKIKECLAVDQIIAGTVCVAFARYDGVETLYESFRSVGNNLNVIVGINNGITSAQALARILDTGAKLYVVNTGNSVIFHPKIYYAEGSTEIRSLIGSANLTNSGLNSNIECCAYSILKKNKPEDMASFNALRRYINTLLNNYQNNVFFIENISDINTLLDSGYLENENRQTVQYVTAGNSSRVLKQKEMFAVKTLSLPHATDVFSKFPVSTSVQLQLPQKTLQNFMLLWESNKLSERDLNIPKGKNTHATGSMGLKKGNSKIEQKSYFRTHVFDKLTWKLNSHKEEAVANFTFKILGNNIGPFKLKITHDTRTNTTSYKQNNMMTHLHWGEAKSVISDDRLLNRYMRLYRDTNDPQSFLIEIY